MRSQEPHATKTVSATSMKDTRIITTERLREGVLKVITINMTISDLSQMNTDTHLNTISVMRATTVPEIMTTIGHLGMTMTITTVAEVVTLLDTNRKSEPTMVVVEATTMMSLVDNLDPTMTMMRHTIEDRRSSTTLAVSTSHTCSTVACLGLCTVRLTKRKRLVSTSSLVKDGEPLRLTMRLKATGRIHLMLITILIFLWSTCVAKSAHTGPMTTKVSVWISAANLEIYTCLGSMMRWCVNLSGIQLRRLIRLGSLKTGKKPSHHQAK